MAWHCISPEVFVNGFKWYCISSALDGSDNIQNDSEEDGNGNSTCEEDAGT